MSCPYRAVLFDLDGTLHDRRTTLRAFLRGHMRRFGHPASLEGRFLELDDFGYRGKHEVFTRLCDEYALTRTPQELLADYIAHGWEACALMPHAHAVMDELRAHGVRVGIVTNGRVEQQQLCLDLLDLTRRADCVVISEGAGISKPDAAIYRLALAELGAQAHEALFIGDSPMNDVVGPQRAGLRAAYLPTGHPLPEGVLPEYVLRDLRDVPGIVLGVTGLA